MFWMGDLETDSAHTLAVIFMGPTGTSLAGLADSLGLRERGQICVFSTVRM